MASGKTDVRQVLERLDSVIEASPRFVAEKQERIKQLRQRLSAARVDTVRYGLSQQLYEEYRSFQSDSAISQLHESLRLARRMGRHDLQADCLSLIAYESSSAGHYPDALGVLSQVDVKSLRGQGRFYYYRAMNHLYAEIGFYSHVKSVRDSAYAVSGHYDELLLGCLDKRSTLFKGYLCRNLFSHHQYRAALSVCDEWLRMTPEDSREFAWVAFFQYLIHSKMGDNDEATYWAACSAISDISHAVMDQGALWTVADLISKSDIDRSYRYIKFAWQCANAFGTDVRTKQILPVLSMVESQYQSQLNKANQRLRLITLLIALLSVGLVLLLIYSVRQRRRLSLANQQLHEADKIKEAYIGRFLALCSDYVNRMDKSRKTVNKMVKAHKIDDLYQMTRSTEQKDKDVEELYGYFDETFLGIFPTFVDDFNALLRPESRIDVEPGKLNTTLRIFALIRLGIDDSGKIANFLHYSVNTIYNYRARTKNGSVGDRDSFEARVKQLGKVK